MDIRKLKTLIDLTTASAITEIEIEEAGERVRIVRPASAMPARQAPPAAAACAPAPQEPGKAPEHQVRACRVGTFYRSPVPGAAPFAEIGQAVKEGEPLCVIAAMKLLNEIKADRTGVVTAILAENGDAVEYGQPLFTIG